MATLHHNLSLQVYAVSFQWRLLIFIWKNLWLRVFEANKKQTPLRSCSMKIRIDYVNQILKNKEKVVQTLNINILTRITNWKIQSVYIYVYHMMKNQGPGPYNSLHHADNRKYFLGLYPMRNRREAHMFCLGKEVRRIWRRFCWEKVTLSWLMNSNIVKPEKCDNLHLA